MSSSTESFDLPESVKYDIDHMDKFDFEEDNDHISKSYQYFVDQNNRLQQENHRYGIMVSQLQTQCEQWQLKCQQQESMILQLQQQLNIQRTNYDNKFNQFLKCANDYDKQKQIEIKQLKLEQSKKYNELRGEYSILHEKYKNIQNNTKYKTWKWCQVNEWIMNTINDQRLTKYDKLLSDNLKQENITDQVSKSLDDEDIYYIGIKNYFDRELLCEHIQKLINKQLMGNDKTQSPTSSIPCVAVNDDAISTKSPTTGTRTPKCDDARSNTSSSPRNNHHNHGQYTVEQLKQIRIRQKNIVYVVGLPVNLCNAKLLKSSKWFGKFGNISRICFNTSPKCVKANSIPTFVTYTNEYDALQAIQKMNLYCLADGTRLKTNYGRTKYCPTFCEGKQCINGKCKFLHQWAKNDDIITEQEINDFNAIRAGPPSRVSK